VRGGGDVGRVIAIPDQADDLVAASGEDLHQP
jgi:hypothetical protein